MCSGEPDSTWRASWAWTWLRPGSGWRCGGGDVLRGSRAPKTENPAPFRRTGSAICVIAGARGTKFRVIPSSFPWSFRSWHGALDGSGPNSLKERTTSALFSSGHIGLAPAPGPLPGLPDLPLMFTVSLRCVRRRLRQVDPRSVTRIDACADTNDPARAAPTRSAPWLPGFCTAPGGVCQRSRRTSRHGVGQVP